MAYNAFSAVKAALRATHGHERIEREFPNFSLAVELRARYEGMMVAIPELGWEPYREMPSAAFAHALAQLAVHVRLSAFLKHHSGPRGPRLARLRFRDKSHVSTGRLLAQEGRQRRAP